MAFNFCAISNVVIDFAQRSIFEKTLNLAHSPHLNIWKPRCFHGSSWFPWGCPTFYRWSYWWCHGHTCFYRTFWRSYWHHLFHVGCLHWNRCWWINWTWWCTSHCPTMVCFSKKHFCVVKTQSFCAMHEQFSRINNKQNTKRLKFNVEVSIQTFFLHEKTFIDQILFTS